MSIAIFLFSTHPNTKQYTKKRNKNTVSTPKEGSLSLVLFIGGIFGAPANGVGFSIPLFNFGAACISVKNGMSVCFWRKNPFSNFFYFIIIQEPSKTKESSATLSTSPLPQLLNSSQPQQQQNKGTQEDCPHLLTQLI